MTQSSPWLAGAWMVGTAFSFSVMALAGRELSGVLSTFEIQFWRAFIAGVAVLPLILRRNSGLMGTRRPALHLARNVVHFGAQCGWFYAIGVIPLAQVFALEFTTPIWTAILAALFIGERITRTRAFAILLGFAGIIAITRPGLAEVEPASLVVLGAAAGYAISYVLLKRLTQSESPLTILFYMSLVQVPLSLGLSAWQWSWPTGLEWLWVFAVGLSGLSAHYCMTRALGCAEASLVAPLEFLRLPMIAIAGFLAYSEPFDPWVIGGAAIILGANIMNLRAAK